MSRSIRVAGRMIELAGLDQVWLGVDHLANSKITLYYPKGPVQTIEYKCGEYAQAEKDAKILKEALGPRNLIESREPTTSDSTVGERLG
jgi:hypothetical protein